MASNTNTAYIPKTIKEYLMNLLSRKFIIVILAFVIMVLDKVLNIGLDPWTIVSIVTVFIGGNSAEHLSNRIRLSGNNIGGVNHE